MEMQDQAVLQGASAFPCRSLRGLDGSSMICVRLQLLCVHLLFQPTTALNRSGSFRCDPPDRHPDVAKKHAAL
jgi:hypothetical protein